MQSTTQINIDRYLRTVLAVAEEHQITRAAIRLGKAQPWVSRQLQALEEEVGVKLFRRLHKGVEETPSGEAFVKEARQAVLHSQWSVFKARSASVTVTDKLLIGVSPPSIRIFTKAFAAACGPDCRRWKSSSTASLLPNKGR